MYLPYNDFILHLHVEPLPEADGVEHVIAAGQLRLRHVLHHITFMGINNNNRL